MNTCYKHFDSILSHHQYEGICYCKNIFYNNKLFLEKMRLTKQFAITNAAPSGNLASVAFNGLNSMSFACTGEKN